MDKPEVKPTTAKRDAVLERIRNKYPDKQYTDDEAYFGQIGEDYDEYDKRMGELSAENDEYRNREAALTKLFDKDPRSAAYLTSWRNGDDPTIAFIRQFGDDVRAILDDPERQEEIAEAHKEFALRVAKENELEQQYKDNLKESLAMIDKFASEGMSDDDIDAVMQKYIKIAGDALMGKFTPEGFDMIRKAMNFDSAVAEASEEGEVKGRNQKIEEKLAKDKKGDGHSPLGGETDGPKNAAPRRPLGALDNFGDGNKSIWERGGEKRIKY